MGKVSDLVTQTLWIDGPLPGMNEMLDARKRSARFNASDGYSRLKTEWSAKIGAAIKAQGIKAVERAVFGYTFTEPDRRRNPDNIEAAKKLILDAFVDHGILANDGWNDVLDDDWRGDQPPGFRVGSPLGVHVRIVGPLATKAEINRRRAKLDKRAMDRAKRKRRRKV